MSQSPPSFLVLGRAGLDLYPDPPGTRIEDAATFVSALGGSSGNIAAGLARLSSPVGLLTRVSDDAVGRYTINQSHHYGIETDMVFVESSEARNTLALSETRISDTQTVIYRNNAADFALCEQDVMQVDWARYDALIFTGTSLAAEPSRGATHRAIRDARAAGVKVLFDVDYRAYSWISMEEAAQICADAARSCDIVIGNDDEFGVLAGSYDKGRDFARSLSQEGRIAVYKMGEKGSITYEQASAFETAIFPVEAIKPTGAGDAFMASFAHFHLRDVPLRDCVLRGSAAAALVVTRVGCAPAMPTAVELIDFMSPPVPPDPTSSFA